VAGRVAPGWYPDYEAPPGHERYWDGEQWTERRSATLTDPPRPAGHRASVPAWVWVAVAAAVAVGLVALGIAWGTSGRGEPESSPPPPASSPGPPAGEPTESEADDGPEATSEVSAVVDGTTLRMTTGDEVRLVGVVDVCAAPGLARLVVGQEVTLIPVGPDRDADGRLLRYLERNGADIGKRLIQRGWATASDEPNPRRAIYRRVDARSLDGCG
jgi:hypothetical protein